MSFGISDLDSLFVEYTVLFLKQILAVTGWNQIIAIKCLTILVSVVVGIISKVSCKLHAVNYVGVVIVVLVLLILAIVTK